MACGGQFREKLCVLITNDGVVVAAHNLRRGHFFTVNRPVQMELAARSLLRWAMSRQQVEQVIRTLRTDCELSRGVGEAEALHAQPSGGAIVEHYAFLSRQGDGRCEAIGELVLF